MNMADVIDVADEAGEPMKSILRKMVIAAYSLPKFQSEEQKDEAIRSFSNRLRAMCYQAIK
jgi:hypothetical protein